jgi:hypothetical protein
MTAKILPLLCLASLLACTGKNVPPDDDTSESSTLSNDGGSDDGSADDGGSDDGSADDGGSDDCTPLNTLLDLSDAPGPGDGYPSPEVSGICDEDSFTITTNQIPHYTFVPMTPNALEAVDANWTITLSPEVADAPTDIPLLGLAGFTVAGTPWYGPNEGPFPDPYGDPIFNGIMDGCMGHTAATYHNHALAQKCLVQSGVVAEPWTLADPDSSEPSPILGWAMDGFPIYGAYGCVDTDCTEVIELESGWEQTGDPTTYAWENHAYVAKDGTQYLDQCNGRTQPDGTYGYHATATFPYILGCYTGTPADSVGGDGDRGGGDDGAPGGDGGGPGGDGGPPGGGPTECETDADCSIDVCPPDSVGCVCATRDDGGICAPSCTTDDDCPPGGPVGTLVCDTANEWCVPEGM